MKQPLVSVCIPTFQHESFIADCLDSVLAQKTNFDFEIILGEDGSTDGTRIICQAYADKNPDRIRLFLRKDKDKLKILGRKSGRFNYLENFKAARGKYIATLDGDDCWLTTDKLQKQVDLLEQYPKAFLCSTAFFTGKSFPKSERVTTPYKFNFFPQNTLGYLSYSGHISNWLFRNELEGFLATPLATKAPILDLLLFAYFKEKGGIVYLNERTSFYKTNEKSYHVQKASTSNYSELFWSSWYQFRYLHQSPIKYLHFLGYLGKKIFRNR